MATEQNNTVYTYYGKVVGKLRDTMIADVTDRMEGRAEHAICPVCEQGELIAYKTTSGLNIKCPLCGVRSV